MYIYTSNLYKQFVQAIWQSSAPCLEHFGEINCSLLVDPSHSDESWKGRNTCLRIYIHICIYIYIYHIYTVMVSFLTKFILGGLELGKK